MGTDFFDDDLLRTDNAQDEDIEQESDGVPVRPITDASLSRMVRQKEGLSNQVAGAVNEIERLRMRQQELEKERHDLKTLTRKQEEYEHGKRDIIDKLNRGIILIEKEGLQAVRMAELLSETGVRFQKELSELERIDEAAWTDDNFETDMNKALVRVDIARTTYRKAMARIDAASWHKSVPGENQPIMLEELPRELGVKKGFGFWLKVGLAISLPMMTVLIIFFLLWLFFTGIWPR